MPRVQIPEGFSPEEAGPLFQDADSQKRFHRKSSFQQSEVTDLEDCKLSPYRLQKTDQDADNQAHLEDPGLSIRKLSEKVKANYGPFDKTLSLFM